MVRRLVLALTVVAVMAGLLIGGSVVIIDGPQLGTKTADAQPGAPDYCGPYQTSWYVSSGSYWYAWVWRWCHNPSIEGGWYVDWVNWYWGSYAGPGYSPGYQYSVPYITQ
jgi:hypothetical protein